MEPGRTLTLAEKGGAGAEVIVAAPGFRLVATMNPGGDYGKKELSPALSNRFTQIWVPALHDEDELASILASRLPGVSRFKRLCLPGKLKLERDNLKCECVGSGDGLEDYQLCRHDLCSSRRPIPPLIL